MDEIQRSQGQRFWTVLSDLVRGEVIGLQKDRSEESLRTLLHDHLDARQRAAVEAVCTDMHRPSVNVVDEVLTRAEIVFDKFHVLQHASAALDEVRRQEFLPSVTGHARPRPRQTMVAVATMEDRLRLETGRTPDAVGGESTPVQSLRVARAARSALDVQDAPRRFQFPDGVVQGAAVTATARNGAAGRLPAEAHRRHRRLLRSPGPLRRRVVEAINTTIKAVLRRARGMRDEEMLLLKLKWATAHPIRSARDLALFLTAQPLYSNR